MDLSLTEEQQMLRASLDGFLSERYSFEKRQAILHSNGETDSGLWRAFATELGILGATFDEKLGGLGGGPVDTMVIMETMGRHLVLEPYLETVVLCGSILRQNPSPLAHELIRSIIAGEARLALAYAEPQARFCWHDVATRARRIGAGYVLSGFKSVVVGAPEATTLIVLARSSGGQREHAGLSLYAVDPQAKGVERRDYRNIDGRRASELHFLDVELPAEALLVPEGAAWSPFECALDEATGAVCAEASGVLRCLLDATVDYTKQRKQFGVPLSTFQVLQHRMVNMLMATEQAIAITQMATASLGGPAADRSKAVSAAKAKVGEACRFVGQSAVQLHGGMGITDELAVGHYFKRATLIQLQFGSTDHHLARYERLSFGDEHSGENRVERVDRDLVAENTT